ncbi:hypothetical protein H8959_015200, partial [Pygathrix nigripes]
AVLSQLPDVMMPPNCDTYPDPPFSCTYDSDPICATDKKTYDKVTLKLLLVIGANVELCVVT